MQLVFLLALSVVQLLGYGLFLKGFFPRKAVIQGSASFSDSSPFVVNDQPHFDKLIFVVVDALRSDFMFSDNSSMNFLHELIKDGTALPFTAYSNPPTVTLPRLKGITTGSTPSFIDAVLNIADDKDNSQDLTKVDSWLSQLKSQNGRRIFHFFGDDTWLKLFPPANFFEKFEGTNSFFVSDFTEVDLNVTRHLQAEINDESWDALILHYLGLDHIGHKGGPSSIFMEPKQIEMDEVLEQLYRTRVAGSNNTLLVLMGDHGMNEIGNHGGSSAGETNPGLVLASPKFRDLNFSRESPLPWKNDFQYYHSISQIDIVPTLSALFNFSVPLNNLGVIIPQVLDLWTDPSQQKKVLYENCKQFMNLLSLKFKERDSAVVALIRDFDRLGAGTLSEVDDYYFFLKNVQSILIREATNYSYFHIACGVLTILVATAIIWFDFISISYTDSDNGFNFSLVLGTFCVFYAMHFHGSSLIEEEHQIWWYLTICVMGLSCFFLKFKGINWIIVCLTCIRLIRCWNNSGQKFESSLTLSNFLLCHPNVNWVFIVSIYVLVVFQIYTADNWIESFKLPNVPVRRYKSNDFPSMLSFIVVSVLSSVSLSFKLCQFVADGNTAPSWMQFYLSFICDCFKELTNITETNFHLINIVLSRLFYYSLGGSISWYIFVTKLHGSYLAFKVLNNLITLFLVHQARVEVIPIFLVFEFLKVGITRILMNLKTCTLDSKLTLLSLLILCLQNLSFFSIGNTNSLATVDISNSYNGLSEYDIPTVGLLTFVSNFGVAIYWSLSSTGIISDTISRESFGRVKHNILRRRLFLNIAFYSLSALSLVAACINLRYHLFIWSVFSPKLLYFAAWNILMQFGVDSMLNLLLVYL